MPEEKKEVDKDKFKDDLERRSNLKASYILVGLFFFVGAILTAISGWNAPFIQIILMMTGILFFVTGISYYDYANMADVVGTKNDLDKRLEPLFKKHEWHKEIGMSLKIAFGIGGIFFLIATFLAITNYAKYAIAILFCICTGATTLTFAFKLKEYRERIEEYDKALEDIQNRMFEKIKRREVKKTDKKRQSHKS